MQIISFVAPSGTGKTTLLTKIIPLLQQEDIKVGVIKHTHHKVDLDKPGKDSYKMRQAGANPIVLVSEQRLALLLEQPHNFQQSIELLKPFNLDLVLVEGFKFEQSILKIAIYRDEICRDKKEYLQHENIVAIITDRVLENACYQIDINDIKGIISFIKSLIDLNNL